jgi:hypothetical protein
VTKKTHRGFDIDVRPTGYGGSLVTVARGNLERGSFETLTEDRGFALGRLFVDLLTANEVRLPSDAFSAMGAHMFPDPLITPLPVVQEWTQVTDFDHSPGSDPAGRVVPDLSAGLFIIAIDPEGGFYFHDYHMSCEVSGGQDKEVLFNAMVVFGQPAQITSATNASPAVCTIVDHDLRTGMTCVIAGETGNTAINGSRVVTNVTPDTFDLYGLDGLLVNGNGPSVGDGSITHAGRASTVVRASIRDGAPANFRGATGLDLSEGDKVGIFYAILNTPSRAIEIWAVAQALERAGGKIG